MFPVLFLTANDVDTFLAQPPDVIVLQILFAVGWVPILTLLVWGFSQIWLAYRIDLHFASLKNILLAIDVPRMTEQSPKAMENMFAILHGTKSAYTWKEIWIDGKVQPRFTFEIISNGGYIQFYVRCQEKHRDTVEAAIYAQYPDAEISAVQDYVHTVPTSYPNAEYDMWGSEFKFSKPNYMPLQTWESFEHGLSQELKDPLAVILEQLSRIRPGEQFWIQFVVGVCDQDWKKEGEAFISKTYGIQPKQQEGMLAGIGRGLLAIPHEVGLQLTNQQLDLISLFGLQPPVAKQEDQWKAFKITMQEKNQVEAVNNKIQKIGFKTKIRMVYVAKKEVYSKGTRVGFIKGMFQPFTNQDLNSLGMVGDVIPKDDYFFQKWSYTARQSNLMRLYKSRALGAGGDPIILTTEELATLYHFPTITIKAPLVKKSEAKRAEPPVGLAVAESEVETVFVPRATAAAAPTGVEAPSPMRKPVPPVTAPVEPEISLPGRSAARKAAPPRELLVEADDRTDKTHGTNRTYGEAKKPSVLPAPPVPPVPPTPTKKGPLPPGLRVLLEPGVEIEDVNIPDLPGETEADDQPAPPNLPS